MAVTVLMLAVQVQHRAAVVEQAQQELARQTSTHRVAVEMARLPQLAVVALLMLAVAAAETIAQEASPQERAAQAAAEMAVRTAQQAQTERLILAAAVVVEDFWLRHQLMAPAGLAAPAS